MPAALPRGRAKLPREVVVVSQRTRLIEGMAVTVAAKGYAATTVADVIAAAGVSRTTFYEQFRDKEQCFLSAYEYGSDLHYEYVAAAVRREDDWLDGLRAGNLAYLEVLAEEPAYAKAFLVEVLSAGARALDLRAEAHRRYVDLLKRAYARAVEERHALAPVPVQVFEAAIEGGNGLVVDEIRQGRIDRLPELEPAISYIHLALMGLPKLAEAVAREAKLPPALAPVRKPGARAAQSKPRRKQSRAKK